MKAAEKEKRRSSVLELVLSLPRFNICAYFAFFSKIVHFIERIRFLELCAICDKLLIYRMAFSDIRARCSVQTKRSSLTTDP